MAERMLLDGLTEPPPGQPQPPPGQPQPSSSQENAHITSLSTAVLVLLVILWSLVGHKVAARSRHLTEGSVACLLGLATGVVLLVVAAAGGPGGVVARRMLAFNPGGFFTYLLPPIIFNCGLSVERHRFFLNLPSILLLGIIGTVACFVITGVFLYLFLGFTMFKLQDALAMGAIFAATDSVAVLQVLDPATHPALFSLVFGEGVINDAVSVVLLGAIDRSVKNGAWTGGFLFNFAFLLFFSFALGAVVGLGIAWVLKTSAFAGPHQELAILTLLAYSSWLLADLMGLSAILSLFVTGMMVSHYALSNISAAGRATAVNAFRTLAYISEGMVFVYLGMDAFDPDKWKSAYLIETVWLVAVLSMLLLVARAVVVVPFAVVHNRLPHSDKLARRDVIIVWWSGLMRGAVSVALVYMHFDYGGQAATADRHQATLIVSTLMVVMASITGVGALTKPLMAMLLRDDGETALAAQLSNMPLLGETYRRIATHTATFDSGSPAGSFTARLPGHLPTRDAGAGPHSSSGGGASYEAPHNQPGTPVSRGGPGADGRHGGGTPHGGAGGLEDAQRRLPLPIRHIVDRLAHFDREVLMPVFSSQEEGLRQGVDAGAAVHAAAPTGASPPPVQQQQQQPGQPGEGGPPFTLI